jgi:hypothetical protein
MVAIITDVCRDDDWGCRFSVPASAVAACLGACWLRHGLHTLGSLCDHGAQLLNLDPLVVCLGLKRSSRGAAEVLGGGGGGGERSMLKSLGKGESTQ